MTETFQVSGVFKKHICRAKAMNKSTYQVYKDSDLIGIISFENGGWYTVESSDELLTAENVQLIGQFIDKRKF